MRIYYTWNAEIENNKEMNFIPPPFALYRRTSMSLQGPPPTDSSFVINKKKKKDQSKKAIQLWLKPKEPLFGGEKKINITNRMLCLDKEVCTYKSW